MSSTLTNPIFRLVVIFAMSAMFHWLLPKHWRDTLIPWCFALIIVHQNVMPFFGGGLHFLFMVGYWIEIAVVLDGCQLRYLARNPVMKAFLFFWGYFTILTMRSNDPYYAFVYSLNTFVELLLIGYYAGIWAVREPDGLRRLLKPVVILAVIPLLIYQRYGFAGELDDNGRAVLDASLAEEGLGQNVNGIALALVPMIVCTLAYLMQEQGRSQQGMKKRLLRFWAIGVLFCSLYFLLRTGSRNGALALLPCLYFILNSKGAHFKMRQLAVLAIGALSLLGGVILIQRQGAKIRAFSYEDEGGHTSRVDSLSSGRVTIFRNLLAPMQGIDYVVGRGLNVGVTLEGRKAVYGGLSVYVTLLYNVGVVGLLLLLVYYVAVWKRTHRIGQLGQVAFLFFAVWAVTGVGEDNGMTRGQVIRLVQGVSMGLCTRYGPRLRRVGWQSPSSMPYGFDPNWRCI